MEIKHQEKESNFGGANYYITIPATVAQNKDLTPLARLLYGEIASLANANPLAYAWIGNKKLASRYGCTTSTISRAIKELEAAEYIATKLIYREGTAEIEKRHIYILPVPYAVPAALEGYAQNSQGGMRKNDTRYAQNSQEGMRKNRKDNNTSNNTDNNTNKKSAEAAHSTSITNDFNEIWQKYPVKRGKKPALAAYKRAIKGGATREQIAQGLANYLQFLEVNTWLTAQNGSTWFNAEGWGDTYDMTPKPSFKGGAPKAVKPAPEWSKKDYQEETSAEDLAKFADWQQTLRRATD